MGNKFKTLAFWKERVLNAMVFYGVIGVGIFIYWLGELPPPV